jgi:hypothetical protein
MCGQVTWCLLLFSLTCGVASSAVRNLVTQEVQDGRLEMDDHQ